MPYPKQPDVKGPLIYMLTFPNEKRYIGQTVGSFRVRMNKHKSASVRREKEGCMALNAAIREHGWDNIKREVLVQCDASELDEREQLLINEYNTIAPAGYNLLSGGNSNKRQHSSMKLRASIKHIRNSMKKNRNRIYYGCIYYHYHRRASSSNIRDIKYSIVDHPECDFKSYDSLEQAVEGLTEINSVAQSHGTDVSEYNTSNKDLEFSSTNTFAEVKFVLDDIVDTICAEHLKADRWKRIARAKPKKLTKKQLFDKEKLEIIAGLNKAVDLLKSIQTAFDNINTGLNQLVNRFATVNFDPNDNDSADNDSIDFDHADNNNFDNTH